MVKNELKTKIKSVLDKLTEEEQLYFKKVRDWEKIRVYRTPSSIKSDARKELVGLLEEVIK